MIGEKGFPNYSVGHSQHRGLRILFLILLLLASMQIFAQEDSDKQGSEECVEVLTSVIASVNELYLAGKYDSTLLLLKNCPGKDSLTTAQSIAYYEILANFDLAISSEESKATQTLTYIRKILALDPNYIPPKEKYIRATYRDWVGLMRSTPTKGKKPLTTKRLLTFGGVALAGGLLGYLVKGGSEEPTTGDATIPTPPGRPPAGP